MKERSELIAYLRGEIVGPSVSMCEPEVIEFKEGIFRDEKPLRRGALAWRPTPEADLEEVLFFDRESPHRKYGAGLLHPRSSDEFLTPDQQAVLAADNVGVDSASPDSDDDETAEDEEEKADVIADLPSSRAEGSEHDFDVTSPDMRRPSSMAISVCLHLPSDGSLVVRLPRFRRFQWQQSSDRPFAVNGRYEQAGRIVMLDGFARPAVPLWRRTPAVGPETEVRFSGQLLRTLRPQKESVAGASSAGPRLRVDVFARELPRQPDHYIVTVVLRNEKATKTRKESEDATLFQTYFEVLVEGGSILPYPESHRPFDHLDAEEQSLALLYRDSATWAIGHGCAAGWDEAPGVDPTVVYADVFPAFETPSMTPDVTDRSGDVIALRMRDLSTLPDDGTGVIWDALESLVSEYDTWVQARRSEAESLADRFTEVADRHLAQCEESLSRIRGGLQLLRTDADVRAAFRLANLSMLLQQIATKHLRKRSIDWDRNRQCAGPSTIGDSPWNVFARSNEGSAIGRWRAFQLAFLLLQLEGIARPDSPDREIIDLIWFPTGGGKTEAYLAVMAFLMWHQRLLMGRETDGPLRDGTNVLMRYTLRMLTTQQFQRAASLICAMEYLRRHPTSHADVSRCTGQRFSLGLWIGGDGTPNNNARAKQALADYKSDKVRGNPLVLTECPWCRTEIGRCRKGRASQWQLAGIAETSEGPRLYCVDGSCEFGREKPSTWLPVEVIDERIYASAPSLVIGTADKFAMLAYRPEAGVIFGRRFEHGEAVQVHQPPSLVVQDELHLIAGPLGTLYGLYESVIERLCTSGEGASRIVPKIISSTATIRGAEDQTLALYARIAPKTGKSNVRLFPSPGLQMGDSFFGVYARLPGGALDSGRLYLGIHASNYGSILTAQVRLYSAALCRPAAFAPEARDPWWTLLAFYNSIRELGGAKTLLDSDIRARLKFLQNRESVPDAARRKLVVTEELTSRLSQSEIVDMMDRLASPYGTPHETPIDACLASSIIEVGVDIDRLSLMGVTGQPKTTAQYIQVTGRVGRKWKERPGLILTIYNPGRSRDRSHFEQFHSYHRRLYERVEPTSATPFALSALQRAFAGVVLTWSRQQSAARVNEPDEYRPAVHEAFRILSERCRVVRSGVDADRAVAEMERLRDDLLKKWESQPQYFERFPPSPEDEYLMLWPGQYSTPLQRKRGVEVPSSLRQVDRSGELAITDGYSLSS